MTRRALALAALAMPVLLLQAQDLNDTWQGHLNIGAADLRIVFKISTENDRLTARMYSIDQGGQGIPASAVTRDGGAVKIAFAAIGGSYEGKLGPDGNTITGTWTQGGNPAPLTLTRATPATAWAIPEPLPPPKAMAADANPSFEVATIKPAKPEGGFSITVNRSGMLSTTGTSLIDLIKFAYDLHPKQISGSASWEENDRYDITAKPDTPGIPSVSQLKKMMQGLLRDRFQLVFHREKKELSVYALTLTKTGNKMTPNDTNPNGLPGFGGGGAGGMRVVNATMTEFGHVLQANILDRPVVDQTGLGTARWDFLLRWTPDPSQAPPGAPRPPAAAPNENGDAPPDLFLAVQQQLGLKLETTKAPVDILVIDKAEKPSAN